MFEKTKKLVNEMKMYGMLSSLEMLLSEATTHTWGTVIFYPPLLLMKKLIGKINK